MYIFTILVSFFFIFNFRILSILSISSLVYWNVVVYFHAKKITMELCTSRLTVLLCGTNGNQSDAKSTETDQYFRKRQSN